MTADDVIEKVKEPTTIQVTWLKLAGSIVAMLGVAFGGGTLGVSTSAGSNAAVTQELAKVFAKLGDRVLVVEGKQDSIIADHEIDGQHGKTLDGFNRMAVEFSSGKSQHFLLVDEVKRNAAEILATRRDIAKIVETIGELKSDVRHVMRTLERKR